MAVTLHPLPAGVQAVLPPEQFTYPFCYEPHPLCVAAADEVRRYLGQRPEWHDELQKGKMFGVLVVAKDTGQCSMVNGLAFLAAFSGTLDGRTRYDYFVPPVFDLMAPGCYFQEEQAAISDINRQIDTLQQSLRPSTLHEQMRDALSAFREQMRRHKAERDALRQSLSPLVEEERTRLIRQSQFEKAEYRRLKQAWAERIAPEVTSDSETRCRIEFQKEVRRVRSQALQQWLFRQYVFLNALGEEKDLPELFAPATPPSGSGECCAPKLLQAAYREGLHPLCMGEFWVGASPADEVRHDGHFYPACNSKCRPILRHMLRGLDVEPNPLLADREALLSQMHIIYNDGELAVVSKPAGMLSVPGRDGLPNVQDAIKSAIPSAKGPLIVHRLDMDTSGLMLIALTEERYHELQDLFLHRRVHKVYHALLERGMPVGEEGDISLPLRPDYGDRPRQMVDKVHGKPAQTHYRVLGNRGGHAFVELCPLTGRTHQLRVHCAHTLGLGNPIVGDRLYGKPADRLMLHAYAVSFDGYAFTDHHEL